MYMSNIKVDKDLSAYFLFYESSKNTFHVAVIGKIRDGAYCFKIEKSVLKLVGSLNFYYSPSYFNQVIVRDDGVVV
jgi:hypothetical protein